MHKCTSVVDGWTGVVMITRVSAVEMKGNIDAASAGACRYSDDESDCHPMISRIRSRGFNGIGSSMAAV